MGSRLRIDRDVTGEELEILAAMARDPATDHATQKRARAVVAFLQTSDVSTAVAQSGLSAGTVRKYIRVFDDGGWQSLLTVPSPRGGDFLSRYDQGYWAERLARAYLDKSRSCKTVPYGTSRSEPFTDQETFRQYAINESLLQAWSYGRRWKRPDLLMIPRDVLRAEKGTDEWTPDLQHWDNEACGSYVTQAAAAIEVETSLWMVSRATTTLSFTVKDEDLMPLRSWMHETGVPLFILQVFYDEAHALPFSTLEYLIGQQVEAERRVVAIVEPKTKKATYKVPLPEGIKLGDVPEPDVEGRVYKALNGRVTVYGRLVGSHINVADADVLERLATGRVGKHT